MGAILLALRAPVLAAAGGHSLLPRVLLVLAVMLLLGRVGAALAERVKQPAVLGELVAGLLLGGTGLGLVPLGSAPGADLVGFLSELGILLVLFEAGLETDLKEMVRVGTASLSVALVGVAAPFVLGYAFWTWWPHGLPVAGVNPATVAVFVGATLTATSVGITARVLRDLNQMRSPEAKIILGAAVIDDVIGLVMLTVVAGFAAGARVTVLEVGKTLAVAVGFLVVAVAGGRLAAPRFFTVVDRLRVRHALLVVTVAFALGLAAVAELAGSALILGAFAAGLILSGSNQFHVIEEELKPVVALISPIFFVSVGAAVDLHLLSPARAGGFGPLGVALALIVLAVVGKVLAGWGAPWRPFRRLVVGAGMVPRGEVGLIFASLGRGAGIVSEPVFGAIVLMVMATTFLAPVALRAVLRGDLLAGSAP